MYKAKHTGHSNELYRYTKTLHKTRSRYLSSTFSTVQTCNWSGEGSSGTFTFSVDNWTSDLGRARMICMYVCM